MWKGARARGLSFGPRSSRPFFFCASAAKKKAGWAGPASAEGLLAERVRHRAVEEARAGIVVGRVVSGLEGDALVGRGRIRIQHVLHAEREREVLEPAVRTLHVEERHRAHL